MIDVLSALYKDMTPVVKSEVSDEPVAIKRESETMSDSGEATPIKKEEALQELIERADAQTKDRNGDKELAIKLWKQVVKTDPEDPQHSTSVSDASRNLFPNLC